ncbi:hypothetical protein ES703_64510 [subsurface metagenome]
MLVKKIIIKGDKKNIAVFVDGNKCECIDYIESLEKKTKLKLKARMNVMANKGIIRNTDIFKYLEDKIYEFKADYSRVYCFFEQNTIICTNGADKAKRKITKRQIDKAKKIRKQYFEEERRKNEHKNK